MQHVILNCTLHYIKKFYEGNYLGWAQWLTPVIPIILGCQDGQIRWGPKFKTSLANVVKPCLYQKNTKISWAWLCASVILATQEAEAGESLEPRNQRLQWAKIKSLHSSLGDRVRLVKIWAKDLNRNFTREDVRIVEKHLKRCWHSLGLGKCKLKQQCKYLMLLNCKLKNDSRWAPGEGIMLL